MHIGNEWDALLADEIHKDYYLKLRQFLISEYTTRRIYPPMEDIFNALRHTSYSDVRAAASVIAEHIQGNKVRPWYRPAPARRADLLGG